jgi:carboxyl-terminal processing protease
MNWNEPHWTRSTNRCPFVAVNSDLGHCWMDGIAYVFVRTWNDRRITIAQLDALIDQYRDAPAMIIDVRPNGGGADNLPLALAGRFATRETTIGYIRYRTGPDHDDFGVETTRRITPRGTFQYT